MKLLLFSGAAALLGLIACAPYAPRHLAAGATADDVTRELGAPTGRYALSDGGTRLEFARGPFGKHTYMVDLDAAGRVLQWQQVLTEENFNRVRAGESSEELLRQLGRPSERRSGDWQGGQVWSYRYQTEMGLCQWFQVSLNDRQTVTDSAYGIDPHCDANDKDRSRE
jgi:hypothetical protein